MAQDVGGWGGNAWTPPPPPQSWYQPQASWYQPQATGWGGTATGEGAEIPGIPPWAGAIPAGAWYGMPSALPWGDWGESPWANVPEGRGPEAQAWMNVALPWYQQQMAWNQFQSQLGWQQEQFGQELGWAQQQQAQQEALQRELANVQAFGQRQRPHARWL